MLRSSCSKNREKNVVRRMFEDDINAKYFIMIDADDTYDITNIDANLKIMKNENFDMMVAEKEFIMILDISERSYF